MAANKNNFKVIDAPIDPDVKIPDAVRRASEAATAAMANAYPVDPNAPPPPVDPNAPKADDTIKIVEGDPPQKLPEKVTPPAPSSDDASWEAKYNSQLGRVRQLTKLLEDQSSRVEALEHMLAQPVMQQAPPAPTPAPTKLISAKEEEDFGPEMVDLMRRAAREVADPEVTTLRAQMAEMERKLNGTSQTLATDARSRMLQGLAQEMPEWNTVNHAPEFHAWLALPDPFTGVIRKKLLTDAYEQNKTPQVLAFFKSFVSELAATTPAEPNVDLPPAAKPQPSKPTLESLAAPGRARAAAAPSVPEQKQIIYTSDINAFYAAKRKGLYNGREAEAEAAERELNRAMLEGRVVTNT